MKIKRNIFQVMCIVLTLIVCCDFVQANETTPIQWNQMVQSQVLNRTELEKLGTTFSDWQVKQLTWPSVSEINNKKVETDPNLTTQCMEWLSKFVRKEKLPVDLAEKLIPMKGWGVVRKASEQRRLCDVFIARYRKGDEVIQIQESSSNVVITISQEQYAESPVSDHTKFVKDIAQDILEDQLRPNISKEFFYVSKIDEEGKITKISWTLEKVGKVDSEGRKRVSLKEAWKIGTIGVEAETDGRFVKFEIVKCVEGPRSAPDPYRKRF